MSAAILHPGERWKVVTGDCLEAMRAMPEGCVDCIVTDPPYGHNNNNNGDLISRRELALGKGAPPAIPQAIDAQAAAPGAIPRDPLVYIAQRCRAHAVMSQEILIGPRTMRAARFRRRLAWSVRDVYPDLTLGDVAACLGYASHNSAIDAIDAVDREVFGRRLRRRTRGASA